MIDASYPDLSFYHHYLPIIQVYFQIWGFPVNYNSWDQSRYELKLNGFKWTSEC